MDEPFSPPEDVYGVVLSGDGGTAGTDTWITHGVTRSDGVSVERCAPAVDWFDVSSARSRTFPALVSFLSSLTASDAAGLDFPFGLPAAVVTEDTWVEFLLELPGWCSSPEDLRRRCERRARLFEQSVGRDDAREARIRSTDRPIGALSPYDESVVEYTFYGLRDVLRPLVLSGEAYVPLLQDHPTVSPQDDSVTLLEVFPGGTLEDLDLLVPGYEKPSESARRHRQDIIDGLDEYLTIPEESRVSLIESPGALKSVLAAYAVYRNTRDRAATTISGERRRIEGQIFI